LRFITTNERIKKNVASQENKVVTMGYNGMPVGINDDIMPWGRVGKDEF